jgi:hypothetical protein
MGRFPYKSGRVLKRIVRYRIPVKKNRCAGMAWKIAEMALSCRDSVKERFYVEAMP